MIEIQLKSKHGRVEKFAFDHALAILKLSEKTNNWSIHDPDYEFVDGKIRSIEHTQPDSKSTGKRKNSKAAKKK